MNADDKALSIAARIADGSAIDWTIADAGPPDAVVDELRAIAALATLHRAPSDWPGPGTAEPVTRWGPLTLLGPVGEGRFGRVYRAWDPRLQRQVALKLLRAPAPESDSSIHAIEEARLLARVRHPNVLTVHGAETINGQIGIWTEFIDGHTLDRVLADRGPLPADEVIAIGVDLCRALSAVHAAGLLHRDIKAQNVMRETGGRIVLMDFGTGHDLERVPSRAGDLSGTPLYLAPELFSNGLATVASDIYALAVLLFRLLTGRFPIDGRTLDEVRAGHQEGRAVLLDVPPDTPHVLARAIARGLALDPSARYDAAGAFEQALAAEAPGVRPPTGPDVTHRRWPWVAAALVVVTTGGAAQWVMNGVAPAVLTSAELESDRVVWTIPQGSELAGPVSHDGRFVAYVDWTDTGRGDLIVRSLVDGSGRSVTEAGNTTVTPWQRFAERSALSRDGRTIAYSWFETENGGRSQLRVADLSQPGQTTPRVLVDAGSPAAITPYDWTPDGLWIAAVWKEASLDGPRHVGLVSAADGTRRSLAAFTPYCPCDQSVSVSPNGRYLAFDLRGAETRLRDIFVVDLESGRQVHAVNYRGDDGLIGWSPKSEGLVFTSGRAGTTGLWFMPFVNGQPGVARSLQHEVSAVVPYGLTGTAALFSVAADPAARSDINIASFDFTAGEFSSAPVEAVQHFVGVNSQPFWSPDGRSFVFRSLRHHQDPILALQDSITGEIRELRPRLASFIDPRWAPDGTSLAIIGWDFQERKGFYRIDTRTGAASPLATFPPGTMIDFVNGESSWPGDGSKLYFRRRTGTQITVVELDVSSGKMRDLHSGTAPESLETIVSPDSGTAYYRRAVDQAEGEFSLIARERDSGTERELYRGHHLRMGTLSPDGRLLSATVGIPAEGATSVVVISVATGALREVIRLTQSDAFDAVLWAPDGQSLLVRTPSAPSASSTVWWVPLDRRTARELFEFGNFHRIWGLRLHPDGRRILFGARSASDEPTRMRELRMIPNLVTR